MCVDPAACARHQAIALPDRGTDFLAVMSMRLAGEGGLVSEKALRARFRRQGHCFYEVTNWLHEGRLRAINRGHQQWLPMFQLTDACALRPDVMAVAEELAGAMDDLEILAWFVCPNEALGSQTPLASLKFDFPGVLEAARLDRFLAAV